MRNYSNDDGVEVKVALYVVALRQLKKWELSLVFISKKSHRNTIWKTYWTVCYEVWIPFVNDAPMITKMLFNIGLNAFTVKQQRNVLIENIWYNHLYWAASPWHSMRWLNLAKWTLVWILHKIVKPLSVLLYVHGKHCIESRIKYSQPLSELLLFTVVPTYVGGMDVPKEIVQRKRFTAFQRGHLLWEIIQGRF